MEILENAALWCVDKAALVLERIGLTVIPLWNRWNWDHDMLTFLLMLLTIVLATVCAGLSLANPNVKEIEREEALLDKLGDWGVFYVMACKLFYFPMLVYVFLFMSPFAPGRTIADPSETFFFTFREEHEFTQLVIIFLLLRFAGVVVTDVVRLRFWKLIKFLLYTIACINLGTIGCLLLQWINDLGNEHLLLLPFVLVINFFLMTIPQIYFYLALILPLLVLISPLLTPLFLIGRVILYIAGANVEGKFLVEHPFAWLYFFSDS